MAGRPTAWLRPGLKGHPAEGWAERGDSEVLEGGSDRMWRERWMGGRCGVSMGGGCCSGGWGLGWSVQLVQEPARAGGCGADWFYSLAEATICGDDRDRRIMCLGNDLVGHLHDRVVPGPRRQHHPKSSDIRRIIPRHRTASCPLQHHDHIRVRQPLLQRRNPNEQPPRSPNPIPPPPIRPRPDHIRSINHHHPTPPTIHHPSLPLPKPANSPPTRRPPSPPRSRPSHSPRPRPGNPLPGRKQAEVRRRTADVCWD